MSTNIYRRKCKLREDLSPPRILTRFKTTQTPPNPDTNRGQKRKLEQLQNIIKRKRINFESNEEEEEEDDSNMENLNYEGGARNNNNERDEDAPPVLKANKSNRNNDTKNNAAVQKALQYAMHQLKYPSKLEGREYDESIHCGVPTGREGLPCVRSLTCKLHKKSDKNKVKRSTDLNELLEIGKLARQSVEFYEQVKHLNTIKEIDENGENSQEN